MVKRKRAGDRSLFLFIIAVVQNRTVGADTIRPLDPNIFYLSNSIL